MSRSTFGILFDIDGTLMDDDLAVFRALKAFHGRYGSELGLSIADLVERWKELLNLHFTRYVAGEMSLQDQRRARMMDLFASSRGHLSPAAADDLFATYEGSYSASWTPYPDALPALAALGGFPLAVLSNGDHAQQTSKLQKSGLASHFRRILTSSEIGCAKPAAEAFLLACQQMEISPGRCVYVGDSLHNDARASASAGLISIWLNRTDSTTDAGVGIQAINSLAELPFLVETDLRQNNL